MAHVLAKLNNVVFENVKSMLKEHAPQHAKDGMRCEQVWKNIDVPGEVLFLFKVEDLAFAKQKIQKTHAEALRANPGAVVPQMTFLDGEFV